MKNFDRYGHYWGKAVALEAAGFHTKSAKKDALECVSRAFEVVMKEIGNKLLAEGVDRETPEHKAMYWGRPDAHVWKEKHAKLFAQFPEEVALANQVAALRAKIVAQEIVPKPKTKTAAQLKKDAEAKTCQICGRPIFSEKGIVAHHGYQRPGQGWQTASCFGARQFPFEVSRDLLGTYIVALENQLTGLINFKKQTASERVPVVVTYEKPLPREGRSWKSKYDTVRLEMTRTNAVELFEEHKKRGNGYGLDSWLVWVGPDISAARNTVFEYFLKQELEKQEANIKQSREYLQFQQGRFNGWKGPTMKFANGKWKEL